MPAGRPPKIEFDDTLLTVIENLAADGKTLAEIASILGVAPSTFRKYRDKISELRAVVEAGRSFADDMVEQSLFARATGYYSTEVKVFMYKGKIIREPVKTWHPPDVGAMTLWLKNRKPDDWREKSEVELKHLSLHAQLVDAMMEDEK